MSLQMIGQSISRSRTFSTGVTAWCLLAMTTTLGAAQVLLDEKWTDGSRAETKRPAETAVWVGRKSDVTLKPGSLTTVVSPSSQKLWLYFTDKEPVKLAVGQKLATSISFVPRGAVNTTSSRGLRIGLFHDPNSPRVESDINNDGGGNDAPWTDAKGYAVQVLVGGNELSRTKPFDLGKRVDTASRSLLGTSGDYMKVSGGEPVTLKADMEYRVTLEIERIAENEVEVTSSLHQGAELLSSWSVVDDGDYLGTEPVCEAFDLLFIRISNQATAADKLEFTNIKVELADSKGDAK
jgi:hypothetical protein